MKITFRTLEKLIGRMSEKQKDQVAMADIVDGINSRVATVSLAVNDDMTGNENLEIDQPYFLIESPDVAVGGINNDVERICNMIGL
jgi:hypothetical protein